jgi:hypothetical protein
VALTNLDSAGTQTVESNPYEAGSQLLTTMEHEDWDVEYRLLYPKQKPKTKVRGDLYKHTLLGILDFVE